MFCTKCGKEIMENSKFCKYCGNEIMLQSIDNSKNKSMKRKNPIKVIGSSMLTGLGTGIFITFIGNLPIYSIFTIGIVITILGTILELILPETEK